MLEEVQDVGVLPNSGLSLLPPMLVALRRLRAYVPLATTDPDDDGVYTSKRRPPVFRITQRRGAYIILFVLFANLAFFYTTGRLRTGTRRTLAGIWAMEKALPQHNPDLEPPEGRDGRCVGLILALTGASDRLTSAAS